LPYGLPEEKSPYARRQPRKTAGTILGTRDSTTIPVTYSGRDVDAGGLAGHRQRTSSSFKLGIITDEISEELDQALDFITHYSLGYCEVREMWQKNVMSLSREELNRAKTLIARHGLRVSSIASPIFKYALPEMPAHPDGALVFHSTFTESDSSELLRKSFEIAHFFGTDKIRVFSYWRVAEPEKAYPYVRDRLAKAADLAARNGIILMVENEYDCNVGSAKELDASCVMSTHPTCAPIGTWPMPP